MYNPKRVLWENLEALMICRYGKANINRLHVESKISKGTISRIKRQESAITLDVLTEISDFFNLFAWQLLVPMLDPKNPPVMCISKAEQELYARISAFKTLAKQIAQ